MNILLIIIVTTTTLWLKCFTVVVKKNCTDKVKQARQTLMQSIAMGERLNSTQLKQKEEEF